MRYDLIVLGHDRHGRIAALEAARRRKRVALIECHDDRLSPTPLLRDAVLRLVESRQPACSRFALDRQETTRQIWQFSSEAAHQQAATFEARLSQHGADLFEGSPRFVGPNEVELSASSRGLRRLIGEHFLLAVGTKPIRPSWVPFDGHTILDRDELLALPRLPKSMIVIGADVATLESAMSFSLLGTRVVFVDPQPRLLASWDRELIHLFRIQAEHCGVRFRLGRTIQAIEKTFDDRAVVRLEGGQNLLAERVLYAAGRMGNTSSLNLGAAGLLPDEQGCLWCNELGQTWVKHIYGVGDVVGFPAVASNSLSPSHRVIEHLFGKDANGSRPNSRGVLTSPELAMVGATEERLRHDLVAYEVGVALFADKSRGQMSGLPSAMLKLLFHRESFELLGVHCLSESATNLIRLGEMVMSLGGTIESFRDQSISDAPLSECYRQAAEDGFARVAGDSYRLRTRPRSRKRSSSQCRLASSPR